MFIKIPQLAQHLCTPHSVRVRRRLFPLSLNSLSDLATSLYYETAIEGFLLVNPRIGRRSSIVICYARGYQQTDLRGLIFSRGQIYFDLFERGWRGVVFPQKRTFHYTVSGLLVL